MKEGKTIRFGVLVAGFATYRMWHTKEKREAIRPA